MIDGVVFVHGGAHGSWCWAKVMEELSIPSVAVDLPGRGRRPSHGQLVTLDACVDAVMDDANARGFERFALVGHSLGGITITEVANRFPDRVGPLVYVDAVTYVDGVNQTTFSPEPVRAMVEADPSAFLPEFDRDTARQLFMKDLDDEAFELAFAQLTPEPLGSMLMTNSGLPRQTAATYVLCQDGNEAGAAPKSHAIDLLRAHFEDFALIEVLADHDIMLSQPTWLRDVVESAVQR